MGQTGVPLDSGPPMPPGQQPVASVSGMAGPQAPGGQAGAGAAQAVLERIMLAEKALRDAAGIVPALAPIIDSVIASLRSGAAKVLMNSQGAEAAPSSSPMQGMTGGAAPGAAA